MNDSNPTTLPVPSADAIAGMRAAHLEMIQGVVSRMSGYSANVKNYMITIVAGLLAFYSQRPDDRVLVFAVLSCFAFALLDAHYLRLEKAFRNLFDEVRKKPLSAAPDFTIEISDGHKPKLTDVACSWSVTTFYIPLLCGLSILYAVIKVWP